MKPTKQDRLQQRADEIYRQMMQKEAHEAAFERLVNSKDGERSSLAISMSYLLYTIANEYAEEAMDILTKYDLVQKKIKTTANNLAQSFESFHKVINMHLKNAGIQKQLCDDYEIFKATCEKFMNADERISTMQALQEDRHREPGSYVCRVEGAPRTQYLILQWDGKQWSKLTERRGWTALGKVKVVDVLTYVEEDALLMDAIHYVKGKEEQPC